MKIEIFLTLFLISICIKKCQSDNEEDSDSTGSTESETESKNSNVDSVEVTEFSNEPKNSRLDSLKIKEYANAYPSNKKAGLGAWVQNNDKVYRLRLNWVYYYELTEKSLVMKGEPDYYSQGKEHFPLSITSILAISDSNEYYFFNRHKYCKRPFSIRNATDGTCPLGWKQNDDLFGCPQTQSSSLRELCSDTLIDGSLIIDSKLYIFRKNIYWIFQNIPNNNSVFGDLITGPSDATEKWLGFVANNDGVFLLDNKLTMISNRKWTTWDSNGNSDKDNSIIEDLVRKRNGIKAKERYQGIVQLGGNDSLKFAVLIGEKVYYIERQGFEYKRLAEISYNETVERFPPNVTAAVKAPDNLIYFFRDEKYCKRPLNESSLNLKGPQFCSWNDNRELFRCNKLSSINEMRDLCEEPEINAAINFKGQIMVFRDGQYWSFDQKPTPDSTPFGNFVEGSLFASDKWKGFDQNNDGVFVIANKLTIFMKRAGFGSRPKPRFLKGDSTTERPTKSLTIETINTEIAKKSLSVSEEFPDSPGAAVLLPDSRIAIVIENKVWYYRKIKTKLFKDENHGPKLVNTSNEYFPESISATLTIDYKNYYFFRGSKYCKRPLLVVDHSVIGMNKTDWGEFYEVDEESKKKRLLNRTEETKTLRASEESSFCIWRENTELFGCEVPKIANKLQELCSNPLTIGTIIYDKFYIYLFTSSKKVYTFSTQSIKPNDKSTDSEDETDSLFKNLYSVSVKLLNKWKGFNPNLGNFFAIDNTLCSIYGNNWYNCWNPNGKQFIIEEIIEELEIADAPNGDMSDSGALIITPEMEGRYVKVVENEVCYYLIRDNQCYKIGKCSLNEDEHNFPHNIIAAIKTRDNIWYYFDSNGKYCERPDEDYSECTEWKDNKEVFGCDPKSSNIQLKSLCKNLKITTGFHYPNHGIYVFRGGKYWLFDNKPIDDKPFGNLVEGAIQAKKKWPKIRFPGGTSYYNSDFIMIYKNKWSRWRPNAGNTDNQQINEELVIEVEEDPDGDNRAMIIVENHERKHLKIDGKEVCFITIRNGKCFWSEKCLINKSEADIKNPPKIFGAIKTDFNNWFIFDKYSKICKRAEKELIDGSSHVIAYQYP